MKFTVFLFFLFSSAFAEKQAVFLLGPVEINGFYLPMTGPVKKSTVTLDPESKSPFLWVKGFRVNVLNLSGLVASIELLSHSFAQFAHDPADEDQYTFMTSQGMEEIKFPEGFAMKVNNQPNSLKLLVQAANDNKDLKKSVNYKVTVFYEEDGTKLKHLKTGTIAILGSKTDKTKTDLKNLKEGGGAPADRVHLIVPRGRHEYRTVLDSGLNAKFNEDKTIHYIKLHLLPYGESVSIYDQTKKEILWTGKAKTSKYRAALVKADFFSSAEGIKIQHDHVYELVAVYNNTTNSNVDGIAELRIYYSN